jgi:hypothetical protein
MSSSRLDTLLTAIIKASYFFIFNPIFFFLKLCYHCRLNSRPRASSGSSGVEQLYHLPKIKGLSPASAAGSGKEIIMLQGLG